MLKVLTRVGQKRIYTPYMTVYLVIPLPKIPYIHRIYIWFWPTLLLTKTVYIHTCTLCMTVQNCPAKQTTHTPLFLFVFGVWVCPACVSLAFDKKGTLIQIKGCASELVEFSYDLRDRGADTHAQAHTHAHTHTHTHTNIHTYTHVQTHKHIHTYTEGWGVLAPQNRLTSAKLTRASCKAFVLLPYF